MTNNAEREGFRKSYGDVIKALADIVANAPQTDEQCEAELIPRPYVMDRVVQIREAMDALSKLWQARAQASGVPDDKSMHGLQAIETAPEETVIVVAWIDEDGCTRYEFEWLQDGTWHEHNERYDHYLSCAPRDIPCAGPSENAPYTHWLPLPILHGSDSKEVPAKKSASVPVERLEALGIGLLQEVVVSLRSCGMHFSLANDVERLSNQLAELIAEYK
jgi:hypothetical protein